MSLENLKIWVSPITHKIYAGYVRSKVATHKVDVTDQVVSAVAEHLDLEQCKYEMGAGSLMLADASKSDDKTADFVKTLSDIAFEYENQEDGYYLDETAKSMATLAEQVLLRYGIKNPYADTELDTLTTDGSV